MPKLVIGNVDNEHMVGDTSCMSYSFKCNSSIVANRLIWLLEAGDILLLPYNISETFLKYMESISGVSHGNVQLIVPDGGDVETQLLTFDVLSSPSLINKLCLAMKSHKEWRIVPYYYDRSIAWLSKKLNISMQTQELNNFYNQGGAEQFNSKRDFRRLATAKAIPIAEGTICSSVIELENAIYDHIDVSKSVIIKQDLQAGGDGNFVITLTNQDIFKGASGSSLLKSKNEIPEIAQAYWNQLTDNLNICLIVEVYYESTAVYYSEFEVDGTTKLPVLLNYGEMRMDPLWSGFEIPGTELKPYQLGDMISASSYLAYIASYLGYNGKINCDSIRTKDGRILFTEVNGRLGGCTHIDYLARKLLGNHYGNYYTILTRNHVRVNDFNQLLMLLDMNKLTFNKNHMQGVIILVEDVGRTNTIEYMIISSNISRARDIESKLLNLLES